ncbi:hypothetical protein Cantr_01889 [Candida viswanathii]|uniref:Uncharacterized protein n=1 Tax=Candida viswanathii TaxID=5486 RepID=A0A367YMD1_9ASCO|nr:hypothetical protein Cantr_01889 [Candida viswanathii]
MTKLTEYLDIILKYVPFEELVKLLEIPAIHDQVLKVLYSTICIGCRFSSFILKVNYGPQLQHEGYPIIKSAWEYVRFLETYPFISPKKLIFDDPGVALQLAREYPKSLKDAEIGLEPYLDGDYERSMIAFCREFARTPFNVTSLSYNNLGAIPQDVGSRLFRDLVTVTVPQIALGPHGVNMHIAMSQLTPDIFPNLTSLSLEEYMFPQNVSTFPANLKKLKCRLALSDALHSTMNGGHKQSSRLLVLQFPAMLENLTVNTADFEVLTKTTFDISHLLHLTKFDIRSTRELHCFLKLPSSLKDLTYDSGHFITTRLDRMCPQLTRLKVRQSSIDRNDLGVLVKLLPPTLKYLRIPPAAFKNVSRRVNSEKGNKNEQGRAYLELPENKVQLPNNLTVLKIRGMTAAAAVSAPSVLVDFEANPLPHLQKLTLCDGANLTVVGEFPTNITRLSLKRVPRVDLSRLASLDKLVRLTVVGPNGDFAFDHKLPVSLRRLILKEMQLEAIYIHAPNLRELIIYRQNFTRLGDGNFMVPDSLKKLEIILCHIDEISVTWPMELEELKVRLNDEAIIIDNYPPLLKHLDLTGTCVAWSGPILTFPEGLETLSMVSGWVTEDWVRALKLSRLKNLKSLDLGTNEFTQLDAECLPTSLVVLGLSECNLQSLGTGFKSLVNLEQLDLRMNRLGPYFDISKGKTDLFGRKIKFVCVSENEISKAAATALFNELETKPDFEFLEVDDEILPHFVTPLKSKVSKMGSLD